MLALGLVYAQASTLIESWENTADGWTLPGAGGFYSIAFSTTTGVTQGSYSWELWGTSSGSLTPIASSAATTALTASLASASTLSFDVNVPSATDFGTYLGFDVAVYQPGGNLTGTTAYATADFASLTGYGIWTPATMGGQATLTWSMPTALANALGANPGLATSLYISAVGYGSGFAYLDNVTVTAVPEPATLALAGLGGLASLVVLRRKQS